MPLDTRIAMGVQPLDVAGAIGRGMELRDMRTRGQMQEQQLAQAQQTMQRQQRLRDLTTGLKTNEERLDAMRQGGFLDEANDFESKVLAGKKTQADIDNTASQINERNFGTLQKRVQATAGAIASLLARPNVTHQDVYDTIQQQVALGVIPPEEGAVMARGLPGSQEALRPFLMTRAAEVASADARLKAFTPNLVRQDLGGTVQMVDDNPLTRGPGAPTSFKKTQTPDSIASNAVTMRGQNMTAATAARGQDLTASTALAEQNAKTAARTLPASIAKLQNEELDAIGTFSGLDADLGALEKQLQSGALKLGLVSNAVGRGRNFLGISTPESANLQSFRSKLENMRNTVLLLNKGVQTEGDAQRAMNELIDNINDPEVVKQRLAEIRQINQRAVQLRKAQIDTLRSNYGAEPLDFGRFEQQPAAIGAGKAKPPLDAFNRK